MGLDIFFNKRVKDASVLEEYKEVVKQLNELDDKYEEEYDEEKREELQKEMDELSLKMNILEPTEEVAYFRKHNYLLGYFDYQENCEDVLITRNQVEDFIETAQRVLDDHSLAEELLPTEGGFFFGSTEYDDVYFDKVSYAKEEMERVLSVMDWDKLDLVMNCWW